MDRAGLEELQELLAWFSGILEDFTKFHFCGAFNQIGFRKILEKSRRTQDSDQHHDEQHLVKLNELEFVRQGQISIEFERINHIIHKLTSASSLERHDSRNLPLFCQHFQAESYHKSNFDLAQLAIRNDDFSALQETPKIERDESSDGHGDIHLLYGLLRYSVSCSSLHCMADLKERIISQKSDESASSSTWIRYIRFALGSSLRPLIHDDQLKSKDCTQSRLVLDRLGPHARLVLGVKDTIGRLLLHDAAAYCRQDFCHLYLDYVQDQSLLPATIVSDAILTRDDEGKTPLHYAVAAGSLLTTELLLDRYRGDKDSWDKIASDKKLQSVLDELLSLAIKLDKSKLVELLLRYQVNVNHRAPSGEAAIYIAAQLGREKIMQMLLSLSTTSDLDIELPGNVRGWTPLLVASVEGHIAIAKLLISAGADQLKVDCFGWTAREHAAFRGHLALARLLELSYAGASSLRPCYVSSYDPIPFVNGEQIRSLDESRWQNNGAAGITESHVLVTLGSPNTRDNSQAVNLEPFKQNNPGTAALDAGGIVEIQAVGRISSTKTVRSVQLPVVEDMISLPWHFVTKDLDEVKLVFSISRSQCRYGADRQVIGSGVALLRDLKHSLAANREGLARYFKIPVLQKDTLRFMGTIIFGVLVVTPHSSKKSISPRAKKGFWKEGGPTQVVGHRGSGANTAARSNLQLGENTIQSYESAVKLGASAVEFDVQLTKDLVPVIFHDFLVMEAGGDTPLYTLRLNQFQHLSEAQTSKGDLSSMAEARYLERIGATAGLPGRPRSQSLSAYDESRRMDLAERMKHTESAMQGDHKGNLRGDSIQGVFPTFEDLFTSLPESIAFNVEMKYPMLWEAEDRNMDLYAPEINKYVDIALSTIYRHGGKRSITFSSFSPEVCILLSLKQQDYPVLFLSKAGSIPVGDSRCSGLQASIHFAKCWGLAGIVMYAEPLVSCPRLIGYAKSAGLKVCSYGPMNNDPENAKVSCDLGLGPRLSLII